MGVASGRSGPAAVLVTREVRWFTQTPLPDSMVNWFTGSVRFEMEQRVDRYDLEPARRGVGVKQRNMGPVDSKHRLNVDEGVELGPGVAGQIEDWLKITLPLIALDQTSAWELVEVAKDIFTRRYLTGADPNTTGCEVELASITIGDLEAWSLCFETFGDPAHRGDALASGVAQFLEETPLPDGLDLNVGSSCGYPAWLSSRSLQPV